MLFAPFFDRPGSTTCVELRVQLTRIPLAGSRETPKEKRATKKREIGRIREKNRAYVSPCNSMFTKFAIALPNQLSSTLGDPRGFLISLRNETQCRLDERQTQLKKLVQESRHSRKSSSRNPSPSSPSGN